MFSPTEMIFNSTTKVNIRPIQLVITYVDVLCSLAGKGMTG